MSNSAPQSMEIVGQNAKEKKIQQDTKIIN